MRYPMILLLLAATTQPAQAEPMTAEEFDAYTRGKTLHFAEAGQDYGAERYLPGRRVLWSFLDGQCKEGRWYAEERDICFVYEDDPEPQCWQFTLTPRGLSAVFVNDPGATLELYEAREADEMLCLGPRIGV